MTRKMLNHIKSKYGKYIQFKQFGNREIKYLETSEITYIVIKESRGGCFHRNQEKKRFVYVQNPLHDI